MRIALPLTAAAALALGGYLAGRAGGPETPAPPTSAKPHARCAHPPPELRAEPAAEEKARAADRLQELQAEFRRVAAERPAQLNALQNFLAANLAEGKIGAAQVLEMFRSETDAAALDVLQGVLAANPEAADRPGILDAFLAIAREDGDPDRRRAAVAYLGAAWDRDGRAGDALLALAGPGGHEALRRAALGTLPAYAAKHPERAEALNAGLLDLARREPDGELRAQALGAVGVHAAPERVFRELAPFLADAAPGARFAAAEKLGDAPPAFRPAALEALDRALAREPEPGTRQILLLSLVKAGRGEAAGLLRRAASNDPGLRADAEEYLSVLARGYVDWSDILREKSLLEAARPR
jgi:hypothetical protein